MADVASEIAKLGAAVENGDIESVDRITAFLKVEVSKQAAKVTEAKKVIEAPEDKAEAPPAKKQKVEAPPEKPKDEALKIKPGRYENGSRILYVGGDGTYTCRYKVEECSFDRMDASGKIKHGTDFGSRQLKFENGKVFWTDFDRRGWIELKHVK